MEEREHVVGKSVTRVDALEKVTGRANIRRICVIKALILRGYCMRISLMES